ncbi:LacI family DNA-binding transcriptional regulator [Microlunatus flavus]|uniref:LacI family transcriptional regulator n=1 Tax=Microlunatus flavus TaxID=1036181 RepID=A0A1H9K6F5_9ACTN|nr:LacI family DNA-binding transcriptional regulator [Microlunatus flavus]SEQ94632.1 LacI family transcriptional regulator [Microlunatus flavus]
MPDEQRPRRPATMKDVAAAADVGLGTVSRVFSNNGKVAASTRQRVEEVAARLNYRPSALGRGLKLSTASNIGLLVTDISNPFYGEFAEGLLGAANAIGHHVILCATGEDPATEREYVDLLLQERVGGIVAFPTSENRELWRSAQDLGTRVLFVDRTVPGIEAACLSVDHQAGARSATEHLLALGHRRIGYLGGPDRLTSGSMREAGYRRAHADVDVGVDERLVVRTRFTRETAYASAVRLLDAPDPPSALFVGNNVLGEAALTAVRDRGLSVPDDISLVMFDDVSWAKLVDPPVTVVAQPTRQLGAMAARTVLTARPEAQQLLLPPQLVVRRSTAAFYG